MNKVFISPEAARDLSQIKQYISTELKNKSAANRIVGSILKDLRGLGRYSEQGPSLEALTGFQTALRMLLCGKHVALYKLENETVFVARVLDARQDYLRVIFGDDYWERSGDIERRVNGAKSLFGILSDGQTTARENEPSKETIVAMREAERIAKDYPVEAYSDMDALFENLRKNKLLGAKSGV